MAITPPDAFGADSYFDFTKDTQVNCTLGEMRLFCQEGETPTESDGMAYPQGSSQFYKSGQRVWYKNSCPGMPCRIELMDLA